MARVARPAVVTAEIVVPWGKDPRVAALTRQIVDLHAKATARLVAAVVAIGQRMAEVRDRLPEGGVGRVRLEQPEGADRPAFVVAPVHEPRAGSGLTRADAYHPR